MRTTQKQIIIRYLQDLNDWIPAYKLRGLNTRFGFCGHQSDRRARELAEEGKIQHKIEGGYAWYKAIPILYREVKVMSWDNKSVERIITLPIKH